MDKIVSDTFLFAEVISDMRKSDNITFNGKKINVKDIDENLKNDFQNQCVADEEDTYSICSYDDIVSRRNSMRSSVVEESDCTSMLDREYQKYVGNIRNDLYHNSSSNKHFNLSHFSSSLDASIEKQFNLPNHANLSHNTLPNSIFISKHATIDLNQDMKKYFHKITCTKKREFTCDFCHSKFVYKKCLINHIKRNHI